MSSLLARAAVMGLAAMGGRRNLGADTCNSDICAKFTTGAFLGKAIDTPCTKNIYMKKLSGGINDSPHKITLPDNLADVPCKECADESKVVCIDGKINGVDGTSCGDRFNFDFNFDYHPDAGHIVESTVAIREAGIEKNLYLPRGSQIPGFVNGGDSRFEVSTDNVITVTATAGEEYAHQEYQCKLVANFEKDNEQTSSTLQDVDDDGKGTTCQKTNIPSELVDEGKLAGGVFDPDKKEFRIQYDLKQLQQNARNDDITAYDRNSIGQLSVKAKFKMVCRDRDDNLQVKEYPLKTTEEATGRRLGGRNLVEADEIPVDFQIRFETGGRCTYDTTTSTAASDEAEIGDGVFKSKQHQEYLATFSPKSVISFTGISYPKGRFEDFTTAECQPSGSSFTLTCDWINGDADAATMSGYDAWFSENDADVAVDGTGAHQQTYGNPTEPESCPDDLCTTLSATAEAPFVAKLGYEVPLTETYYDQKPRMECTDAADTPTVFSSDSGAPADRTEAKSRKLYLEEKLIVSYSAQEVEQDTVVKQKFKKDFGDAYCADTDDCEPDDADPVAKIFQFSKTGEGFSGQKVKLLEPVPVIGDFIDLTADKFTQYGKTSWACRALPHVSVESPSSCDGIALQAAGAASTSRIDYALVSSQFIGAQFSTSAAAKDAFQAAYDEWVAGTLIHVPKDYEIEFYDFSLALVDRDGAPVDSVALDGDVHFRERSSSVMLTLSVESEGTQLKWSGSDASKSEQFDGKLESWESPDEDTDGAGNNKGLFLVDQCRFCDASYTAVQFDKYDETSKTYTYVDATGYELFKDPAGDANFNTVSTTGNTHSSSVCAQKAGETGYDASSVMCHSKTTKDGSENGALIFADDHAYDCLDAKHIIKVSLRKSTGDDRVKEEFVEVFKTYERSARQKFQLTGADYEIPQATLVTDVLNVEVGTLLDENFQLQNSVTQAGQTTTTDLVFQPTEVVNIDYSCNLAEAASKTRREYTKSYFHPCDDSVHQMTFERPVRGLYSERQAKREVSGGEDWKIREYDLERGTQTFSFQVAAPFADNGVDTDLVPVVVFKHGTTASPQHTASCVRNADKTQTCSFTLSKQSIDESHKLGLTQECGGTHAVQCPTIEIELKTAITTPFRSSGSQLAITGGAQTDAFWASDTDVDGQCGGTNEVKLPITDAFDRMKTYTLRVTGDDNSYDQIISVDARTSKIGEALVMQRLADTVEHGDDATGKHDALDTLMSSKGAVGARGNAYVHMRIGFTKDDDETQYKIDVASEADSNFNAFVCSQQEFGSECVSSGTETTITLEQISTSYVFIGVSKKQAADVCHNRLGGEDAFALGSNDRHFRFSVERVNQGGVAHTYRVPIQCPDNGYTTSESSPELVLFGGLRPSAASPAHRQVKSAKIAGFVAEDQKNLFANGVQLDYTRMGDGSLQYFVKDIYQEQMAGACAGGKFDVNFKLGSGADAVDVGTESVPCTQAEFEIFRTVVGTGGDAQILEEGALVPNHLLSTNGDRFSLALQIVGDDVFANPACEKGDMWVEQGISAPGFVSSDYSTFQRASSGEAECDSIPLTEFKLHARESDGERCRFALITLSEPSADVAVPRFVKFRVQCPRVDDADADRLTDKLELNYGIESALLGVDDLQIELAPKGIGVGSVTARFGSEDQSPCSTRSLMESQGFCNLDDAIGSMKVINGATSTVLQNIVNCGGVFNEQEEDGKKQLAVNVDVQRQQKRDTGAVFGQKFYCGVAKLAFVYETTATTSAVITVDSPVDKIYAVGIDDLRYEQCGDDGGYRLAAKILVKHGDGTVWQDAGEEVVRGAVEKFGWADAESQPTLGAISDGSFDIQGACQPKPDANTCSAYENTRMLGFSLSMTINEVVYTGRANLELRLDCPINQDEALDGEETAAVAQFNDDQIKSPRVLCPPSGTALTADGAECADSGLIAADSNILLVVEPTEEEARAFEHTFEEPTVNIGDTGAIKVSLLTDQFRAVVEAGEKLDFLSNSNKELRLRALPLAGTSAEVKWVVTRDAPKRRARQLLEITYSLGADGSVEKSTTIAVLPAVRTSEQDSVTKYTETVTTVTDDKVHTYNQTVETTKPTEVTAGMSLTAIILASVAAAGSVAAVIVVVACRSGGAAGATGYAAVSTSGFAAASQMDWSRDRFKPDFL